MIASARSTAGPWCCAAMALTWSDTAASTAGSPPQWRTISTAACPTSNSSSSASITSLLVMSCTERRLADAGEAVGGVSRGTPPWWARSQLLDRGLGPDRAVPPPNRCAHDLDRYLPEHAVATALTMTGLNPRQRTTFDLETPSLLVSSRRRAIAERHDEALRISDETADAGRTRTSS
jgi:hypothetical protein